MRKGMRKWEKEKKKGEERMTDSEKECERLGKTMWERVKVWESVKSMRKGKKYEKV